MGNCKTNVKVKVSYNICLDHKKNDFGILEFLLLQQLSDKNQLISRKVFWGSQVWRF